MNDPDIIYKGFTITHRYHALIDGYSYFAWHWIPHGNPHSFYSPWFLHAQQVKDWINAKLLLDTTANEHGIFLDI